MPAEDLPDLPTSPPTVLTHAPVLRALQAERPIVRVRTPAGDEAWLVTRYAEVKQLFTDRRIGRTHPDPERAPRIRDHAMLKATDLYEHETEHTEHAQLRALLTPYFSAKRMRALQPGVQLLADRLLDEIAAAGPPADLHRALSLPLSVRVLCELLGVPYAERDRFQELVRRMADLSDEQRSGAGQAELIGYMSDLVSRKRRRPEDDVISGLCAVEELADDTVAGIAAIVLFAGHDSVADAIDLGTLLLLTNVDQRDAVLRDPELVDGAVEEILRTAERGGPGLPRYAREDVEIGGVTIRAGEAVLLDTTLANFDGSAFDEPDRFDVTRAPNPHLAFAHGPWHCLGAPLARIELRTVFASLLPRFPALRLAVPVEELRLSADSFTSTLVELPVTW
ncbi:cytochrome P450 [Saccharopolyspora sp. 5N102]|uniref:cytochrome P450 n=1 Tax=Saccharopolyspora sp. 5N102 TaxID=3375155 RepID=UPI003796FC61